MRLFEQFNYPSFVISAASSALTIAKKDEPNIVSVPVRPSIRPMQSDLRTTHLISIPVEIRRVRSKALGDLPPIIHKKRLTQLPYFQKRESEASF